MAATTLDNLKDVYSKYKAGLVTLGDVLAVLNRFLDVTEEEPEAPAPAPAPAVAKKEK
jgi:hypothetical protein